jgi:hypothetical protein
MMQRNSGNRRPAFHVIVLTIGFIVGGLFQNAARAFLPPGAVKQFFTDVSVVVPSVGPLKIDLVILNFQLGPLALDVSLISVLGVLLAYVIARSLF